MTRPRYKEWAHRIDVERFLDACEGAVLSEYEERVNKRGAIEYVGQCPDPWNLHKNGDSTGKFAIASDRKAYNCFVCGGGSLVSLVMAVFNLEADDALDFLYPLADDAAKSDDQWMDDIDRLLAQLGADPHEAVEALPYFNPHLLDKWDPYAENLRLWNEGEFDGKPKHIAWDTLLWNARYAPDVTKYPPRDKKGVPLDDPYNGPAVLFPHYVGDRLVGWQHRWLSEMRPKWIQKYTNTPDFPKATTLYRPLTDVPEHLPVVVVESVPTALYVAGRRWPCVATFGATVTPEQLKLLRRFQQGVILAPDCDRPGVESLVKMADYLDGFVPVSYVEPEGHSGDDLLDRGAAGESVELLLREAIRIA